MKNQITWVLVLRNQIIPLNVCTQAAECCWRKTTHWDNWFNFKLMIVNFKRIPNAGKAVLLGKLEVCFSSPLHLHHLHLSYPDYHSGSILFLYKVNPPRFCTSFHGFHSYLGQVSLLSTVLLPMAQKHALEPYHLLKHLSRSHILLVIPTFLGSLHRKTLRLSTCAVSISSLSPFPPQPAVVMSRFLSYQHESSQGHQ